MRQAPIAFVLAFLAFLAVVAAMATAEAEIRVVEPKKPETLPAFTLQDHAGRPFTAESFKGRWSLTLIGYTYCPDVCPFVLTNMAEVLNQMTMRVRPDKLPQVLFLAVDPKRDQEHLASYVGHFGPQFVGATGDHKELAKLVKGLDGFYRLGKPGKDGNYEVQHSAAVIVTGPDGRIHAKLSPPLAPSEVAEYLARKQIAYNREQRND